MYCSVTGEHNEPLLIVKASFELEFAKIFMRCALLAIAGFAWLLAWFPLVLRIVRIGDSWDFPILGFLQLLHFLGQPGVITPIGRIANYSWYLPVMV